MSDDLSCLEAEQAVLGSILLEPISFTQLNFLSADSFAGWENKAIYDACHWCFTNSYGIDVVTVLQRLRDTDSGVSTSYLSSLSERAPTASNALSYARILFDRQLRRNLYLKAREIKDLAFNLDVPATDGLVKSIGSLLDLDSGSDNRCDMSTASSMLIQRLKQAQGSEFIGLSTGYPSLDYELKGIPENSLVTLAAESGTGKTVVGLNLALAMATKGQKCLYISLEVPSVDLAETILSAASKFKLDYSKFFSTKLANEDFDLIENVSQEASKLGIFFAWNLGTIQEILSVIEYYKKKEGIKHVFIDHLQLLTDSEDYQVYVKSTKALKSYALANSVNIWGLSQLNSQMKIRGDKDPSEHDLRGGKNLGQDSDIILFLYKLENDSDQVYLKIHKVRRSLHSKPRYYELIYSNNFRHVDFKRLDKKPVKDESSDERIYTTRRRGKFHAVEISED